MLSCRRRKLCGLAEFKPDFVLSRPEFLSVPAWGYSRNTLQAIERETYASINFYPQLQVHGAQARNQYTPKPA